MKTFLSAIMFALSVGLAQTSHAQWGSCVNNNSRACVNARNAFAEHHGGQYPGNYYNHWYQGNQGRWTQEHSNWRWEGMNSDQYSKGAHGWEWKHHRHHG
jgi:hypothetical protein